MINLFLCLFAEYDYSLEINEGKLPPNAGGYGIHCELESFRCVAVSNVILTNR